MDRAVVIVSRSFGGALAALRLPLHSCYSLTPEAKAGVDRAFESRVCAAAIQIIIPSQTLDGTSPIRGGRPTRFPSALPP